MLVRRSAIRPIAHYSRVSGRAVDHVVQRILRENSREKSSAEEISKNWFASGELQLQARQPALGQYLLRHVAASEDIQRLAQQLRVGIFLMFEHGHNGDLLVLGEDQLNVCEASLRADEELRISDPVDPMDTEDMVGVEQPELMSWLNARLAHVLSEQAETIDVDDVGKVFRSLLVAVLALSEAVQAPSGIDSDRERGPIA